MKFEFSDSGYGMILAKSLILWLGREGSNLRMAESKSPFYLAKSEVIPSIPYPFTVAKSMTYAACRTKIEGKPVWV